MAGEWIKARADLFDHPRFMSLCSDLIDGADEHPGLLVYVCGKDVLGVGVLPPSNESVTERALRGVTEAALRDVVCVVTQRVWLAVSAHCKVRDLDAIMEPMRVSDVDRIARVDGFGEALIRVGWLREGHGGKSLIFPNFLEFNEPACLRRPPPKTNAERQRKWRQTNGKTSARVDRNETVTKSNDHKIREDKSVLHLNVPLPSDLPITPVLETPKKPKRRWHRVPGGEVLGDARVAFGVTVLGDEGVVRAEWAKFCDHEFGVAKSDVDACWRNWVREADHRRTRPSRPPPQRQLTAGEVTMANAHKLLEEARRDDENRRNGTGHDPGSDLADARLAGGTPESLRDHLARPRR